MHKTNAMSRGCEVLLGLNKIPRQYESNIATMSLSVQLKHHDVKNVILEMMVTCYLSTDMKHEVSWSWSLSHPIITMFTLIVFNRTSLLALLCCP
jgi:hypothetical protein